MSSADSSSSTARSKGPNDRQIYVPRGRREINEKNTTVEEEQRKQREAERAARKTEDDERMSVSERRRRAFLEDDVPSSKSELSKIDSSRRRDADNISPTSSSSSRLASDVDFRDRIDDEKLATCCIVFDSFPADMSERSKDVEIKPYLDAGGLSHWFGPRLCVIVFMNENLAKRSLNLPSRSMHRPASLQGSAHCTAACLSAMRDLHSSLKPERDSRVANRLIGAALGVRVPTRPQPAATAATSTAKPTIKKVPTPQVAVPIIEPDRDIPDSWDD